jgi:hypothetical protein
MQSLNLLPSTFILHSIADSKETTPAAISTHATKTVGIQDASPTNDSSNNEFTEARRHFHRHGRQRSSPNFSTAATSLKTSGRESRKHASMHGGGKMTSRTDEHKVTAPNAGENNHVVYGVLQYSDEESTQSGHEDEDDDDDASSISELTEHSSHAPTTAIHTNTISSQPADEVMSPQSAPQSYHEYWNDDDAKGRVTSPKQITTTTTGAAQSNKTTQSSEAKSKLKVLQAPSLDVVSGSASKLPPMASKRDSSKKGAKSASKLPLEGEKKKAHRKHEASEVKRDSFADSLIFPFRIAFTLLQVVYPAWNWCEGSFLLLTRIFRLVALAVLDVTAFAVHDLTVYDRPVVEGTLLCYALLKGMKTMTSRP